MRNGTDICSHKNLSDLEYSDDVALVSEDPTNLQVSLDRVNDSVGMYRMRFAPSKCKMRLSNWIGSKPDLFLAREKLSEMSKPCYLGGCFSCGGLVAEGFCSRMQKT